MPTYHYRCKSCAHEFDQFQKFAEDPLKVCPSCGQEIRRVIQPVGVVFKGSGWYITDSRPASSDSSAVDSKPAAKADVPVEAKAETETEKKAESKETKAAAPV